LFSRSISLATVTPSLVTVGEPNDFSMTTLRPGAEGHGDRVGQHADFAQDGVARHLGEVDFLGCHLQTSGRPAFLDTAGIGTPRLRAPT
jgi:hypothetical protein